MFVKGSKALKAASRRASVASCYRLLSTAPCMLESLSNIAVDLRDAGKLEQSHSLFQQLVAERRQQNGSKHVLTIHAIGSLSSIANLRGHLDEAESLAREAVAGARKMLGGSHPDTLGLLTNLSNVLKDQGKLSEAEPLAREAVDGCRDMLGSSHPDTLISLANLTQARRGMEHAFMLHPSQPAPSDGLIRLRLPLPSGAPETGEA